MPTYYLGGGEIPSHRKIINEIGAPAAALSFIGLSRKIKNLERWHVEDKFSEGTQLFLDSGTYSINRAEDRYTLGEITDLLAAYERYVAGNVDRLALISEFDALPLDRETLARQRETILDIVGPEKFLPIWHEQYGLAELNRLGETYLNVGVTATALAGRNLTPTLNHLSANGVSLHGVGITSLDDLYSIKWSSVSSTSWVSPQQYGETLLWTGKAFKRYPKKLKDQARKRYRTYFEQIGFDPELIETDDHTELLRLSAWSWQQLMDDIDKKQGSGLLEPPDEGSVVTHVDFGSPSESAQTPVGVVDIPVSEPIKTRSTPVERETVTLPILGLEKTTEKVMLADGTSEEIERSSLRIRSKSIRPCHSCFIATKCPAFEPDSLCAYDIPVLIKTRDQVTNLQNSLIEIQAQRVLLMRAFEEMEGGYADPNLSQEMDRLNKLIKTKHDMEQEGFSVKLEAKGSSNGASAGMLARLFGEQASERVRALPQPVEADQIILEAEIIEEWEPLNP